MRSCFWVAVSLLLITPVAAQDRFKFEKEVKAAVKKFQEEFNKKNATVDDKAAAVRDISKFKHEKVLEAVSPLLRDGPVPVRIVAAREMGGFGSVEGTARKLMEAYSAKSNEGPQTRGVRITILRSLGELRAKEAVDFLNDLIADSDEYIAKAAIDATGKLRQKISIDKLLKEYKRLEGKDGQTALGVDPLEESLPSASTNPTDVIRSQPAPKAEGPKTRRELLEPALNAALRAITKESHKDLRSWESWWGRKRSGFRVPD